MPLLSADRDSEIATAADALAAGGLVAFATETVYGLGANALDDAAVARIFAAKGRPADHPLIVHVASVDAARRFADLSSGSAQRLMAQFWPGPLTLILPRLLGVASAAAGGQGSVGLRMPAHPAALALLQQAAARGVWGVAAPSANRFGRVSPTTAAHVVQEFGPAMWVLDGGPCSVGIESTILDCTREPPALLRPGQLGAAALQQVLGAVLGRPDAASPRASGTLQAHYAPQAAVQLLSAGDLAAALAGLAPQGGQGLGVYSRQAPAIPGVVKAWHPMPATAAAAAHELFGVLREFDALGVSRILVEQPPESPDWAGVRDRLQRAAAAS